MIPILYERTETSFTSNGLGRLSSCIRCTVTEERNGVFECEFDYPVTGELYSAIEEGRIIACTHDDQGDAQPFDIYGRSEPINGTVTFYAHHISYRQNEIVVKPFTAGSCVEAVSRIKPNSVPSNPFTYWTDKTVTSNYKITEPRNVREVLAGSEGSLLDVFGTGEYEFDKFDVKLYLHRGQDTNVSIRYGKNLVDFTNEYDSSAAYTAVVPYWLGDVEVGDESVETLVMLPEVFISSGHGVPSGREVVVPMDLSDEFEDAPTESELRSTATSRLNNSQAWLPNQTIKVDFVQLWQTEEYKEYAPLQRLKLCDTCEVVVPMYNLSVRAKVIRVVYNVLLDRYDEMELGDKPTTYSAVIERMYDDKIAESAKTTRSQYDSAIAEATQKIRGGMGGYVVTTVNANGQPIELLITDNLDLAQAVNVWRWNEGGLGHSSNGYDGPFSDVAITADGKINASMILTGVLTANLITAGTITDVDGDNYWNLDTGEFVTKKGRIADFDIESGRVRYKNATRETGLYSAGFWQVGKGSTTLTNPPTYYYKGTRLSNGSLGFVFGTGADAAAAEANADALWGFGIPITGNSSGLNHRLNVNSNQSYPYNVYMYFDEPTASRPVGFSLPVYCASSFTVGGTKSRIIDTENYSERLLYCYETPTPLFGDVGEAQIDSDGICYVDLDDIFTETIANKVEYQVFLQKEGEGDCWIGEKTPRYFTIHGTPNLKVAWELKAKQRDYEMTRLEQSENGLEEYSSISNVTDSLIDNYINEQEDLLYGNY